MGTVCIEAENYSLDLSMYPSFLSTIYAWLGPGRWVRILGPCAHRQEVVQDARRVCCRGCGCSAELLRGITGYWCRKTCSEGLREAPIEARGFVEKLLLLYPGLSIAAATTSIDRVLVAFAALLSRSTSYQYNVIRWMRTVFRGILSVEEAVGRALEAPSMVKSFQAKILARVAARTAEIVLRGGPPCRVRAELLGVPGVGAKTANAIILFTGYSTACPPPDTHLSKLVSEMMGIETRPPPKRRCGYSCAYCSYTGCPARIIASMFKGAAGLVQTLAYTHYSLRGRSLRAMLARYYSPG